MDILLECARVIPDSAALRRAAKGVDDWPKALNQAGRHGLKPLLHWRLSRHCSDAVPPEVAAQLGEAFHANAGRNLMAASELKKVFGWLEAAGVAAIAFKGPTLTALAYENLALREFHDLDVLIQPRDRTRAVSLLVGHGCRDKGAPGAQDLPGNNEIALKTPSGSEVDLHWAVSPRYFLEFDASWAWERTQRVLVAGVPLPTFGPDDLFASVALNGACNCWASLKWICDVANLIRVAPPAWDRLLENRQTRRAFRLATLLAADLLDAPVPAGVLAAARSDQVVIELARQVSSRLFAPLDGVAGTRSEAAMQLRMTTMVRDKARYVWRRALQPNQTDNDFLSLHPSLRRILWLVRPFRILAKFASSS